ncbi:unnamed protein product [Musa acuminata subsp. malaccensis]|uniref:(wild Malaysian banana) hypothetical protein n=1 Tax=Musa acuminata subsp. malaccensis TaxID=214687 RepID=A0A804JRE5_MUSAM|nr:unnamed protein product [Musa acuminata subsp. malaccensis]
MFCFLFLSDCIVGYVDVTSGIRFSAKYRKMGKESGVIAVEEKGAQML